MLNNVIMKGKDTIAAKLAECFITIGKRRYNFMQMIDMEAKVEKQSPKFHAWAQLWTVISPAEWKEHFRVRLTIINRFLEKLCLIIKIQAKIFILKCR